MEHQTNHYHSLIMELQNAKKCGFIENMMFLEKDLVVLLSRNIPCSKVVEISAHIEKKYKIYTESNTSNKKIIIYDVYCLDSAS